MLDALEPPAAVKDIHENYADGAGKLREALDAYETPRRNRLGVFAPERTARSL